MDVTIHLLRFLGGLVGIGLTAAGLTVTTVFAETPAAGRARTTEASVVDVAFQRQGALNHRRSDFHRIYLYAGETYRFVATCDVDCSDVDLRLRNSAGTIVAEDVLGDDVPIVDFTPSRSGYYRIEVRMWQCSINPCSYDLSAERW